MARTVIFGGHGKVALLLASLLTSRGEEVTAVIRNPEHMGEVRSTGAEPIIGDVEGLPVPKLAELIAGHDAVVWSAGAGGGNPSRTFAVDRDAAIRSIDAAVIAGVDRYVMVSYFGAGPDHGIPEGDSFFPYAEAKAAADQHLRASGLHWTIVAPSRLTLGEPTGLIDTDADRSTSVSRADVAAVIAAVLDDGTTEGRTVRFNSGDQPIVKAIQAPGS